MRLKRDKFFIAVLICSLTSLSFNARGVRAQSGTSSKATTAHNRRAPVLGADLGFAEWPHPLIKGWQNKQEGEAMADAFRVGGVSSLRFLFGGLYSPRGPEATAAVKAENHRTNEYPWFPLDQYVDYIAAHEFTTVVGVNLSESPDVAFEAVQKFIERGLKSKLVAVELSNEPHLNPRPWLPEDFAARAATVIERLTPLGVPFALPLTVGKERNTPTKLSDNEWNTRMLRALSARIDLKNRKDIYGVLHLYARGVHPRSIKTFSEAVKPFAPHLRYLVTEFNIRLSLDGNPHLTDKYAMEFARKLAALMVEPDIEAMYVHAVPYHSIMYWANGKKTVTVKKHSDPKLSGDDLARGWHLTPSGKVYGLYSRLAWNGDVIEYRGGDNQSYWAVRAGDGSIRVTLINDSGKTFKKKIEIAGRRLDVNAPARSIVCFDEGGRQVEQLVFNY